MKPLVGSSVGPPGACMTPSMETMAPTIIFRMGHSPCLRLGRPASDPTCSHLDVLASGAVWRSRCARGMLGDHALVTPAAGHHLRTSSGTCRLYRPRAGAGGDEPRSQPCLAISLRTRSAS